MDIKKLARHFSGEDVGHMYQDGTMCACGVSELSISDEGVCQLALEKLLTKMGEAVALEIAKEGKN